MSTPATTPQQAPRPVISVVIPTLNAAGHLPELLSLLQRQQPTPPDETIIIDSGSTDATRQIAESASGVRLFSISNFSHGKARNFGAQMAEGEHLVFLSQDALPCDHHWLASLIHFFRNPIVAAAYSRQLPRQDANAMETFFLSTQYPVGEAVYKSAPASGEPTLSQVFFSNVSCAIRRSILLQSPFDEELIMSEDQQFSRDVIKAGYTVVYAPESKVFHSHSYGLAKLFQRQFDSVYSLRQIFKGHGLTTSAAMGCSYLGQEIRHMVRNHPAMLPYSLCCNVAKIAATLLAHLAPFLPKTLTRRCSLHRYYWK